MIRRIVPPRRPYRRRTGHRSDLSSKFTISTSRTSERCVLTLPPDSAKPTRLRPAFQRLGKFVEQFVTSKTQLPAPIVSAAFSDPLALSKDFLAPGPNYVPGVDAHRALPVGFDHGALLIRRRPAHACYGTFKPARERGALRGPRSQCVGILKSIRNIVVSPELSFAALVSCISIMEG